MAFIHGMGGSGEQYTETSLWTNPSPTSSSGFTAQTVTLSEGLSNFKYIGIKYAYDYARTTDSNCVTTDIMLVTDFTKSKNDTSYRKNFFILGAGLAGVFERVIYYTNDTQIYVGVGVTISSGSAATNNTICIPLEIIGINELDHGKNFDETTLWTNPNPNSAISSPPWDVELSDSMSNYDYIKISYKGINTDSESTLVSQVISYADLVRTTNARFALFALDSANALNARQIRWYDDTHFRFGTCSKVGATGNVTTTCIPYQIIGCNFV